MTNAMLDVTKEIKIDHDNVRDLFDRFKAATDLKQKVILANTLVREMAIHGDAEEASVYNDYSVLGLGDTAAHNKEEHEEIKRLVLDAGKTSVDKPEYGTVIERAVTTFLTHAKEEEDEQHPIMRARLSPENSDKLARTFLKARKVVPTRSQASSLAQKAAGAAEAVTGREFADLRFAHPEI
ncbi:hypothetical protein C8Q70DRAFT_922774 [Cubamyces menziesii]|uniref:Hemerythrin-like domain-containing protein n=1 Tax=Trametes cubensis TaxID=1111947 RepID=A0AAD7TYT0_9APHY|nr:hypothetical protein C8Q70DRAFT_922774 [Cubamyces menziesii]KAJ8489074.1 hypothetical protein ONZ51_g3144 [Trametes cubensis]